MTMLLIRILFLSLCAFIGYYIGSGTEAGGYVGAVIAAACGLLIVISERSFSRVSLRGLSSIVFGLLLGILMAKLMADILTLIPMDQSFQAGARVILTVVFSYLGGVMAIRGKDEFHLIIPYVQFKRSDVRADIVLLDTSAIIDGRVKDIYLTHFLSGRMVVPRFVLAELQKLCDSAEDIKRQRGRRGLDLLKVMQEDPKVDVRVHEDELDSREGVDARLVRLAKIMDARICTTDYNLAQSAGLQGVQVLNVHELANVAKANFFTGEEFEVVLIKEGKEQGQAVAYLDDGTMVVVSHGRDMIGKRATVTVMSVLQTSSGKMIFAEVVRKAPPSA